MDDTKTCTDCLGETHEEWFTYKELCLCRECFIAFIEEHSLVELAYLLGWTCNSW